MRTILAVVLLSATLFGQSTTDSDKLLSLAREFGNAWLKGDVTTLDHLLATEYTHTDVTGKVLHRADWLADASNVQKWARPVTAQGEPSIEFEDMQVTLLGDTAVITGGNLIRSADPKQPALRLRFTQVWVRERGEWKRRFFEATPVMKPGS
jgi:ketosteroid isomerase-like protein